VHANNKEKKSASVAKRLTLALAATDIAVS